MQATRRRGRTYTVSYRLAAHVSAAKPPHCGTDVIGAPAAPSVIEELLQAPHERWRHYSSARQGSY
jgi:hypothetical protein